MVAVPTPHRFTRDEYYRMGEAGLFIEERVELLDGEILTMPPQNPLHSGTTSDLSLCLQQKLGSSVVIRVQMPIVLNDWSEPEPDIAVCRLPNKYRSAHPTASDVLLVIEVSESTLAFDRGRKVAAYAGSGIPEYWIVNLVDRRIEVFSDPDTLTQRYRQERLVVPGDTLLLPGGVSFAVSDVL